MADATHDARPQREEAELLFGEALSWSGSHAESSDAPRPPAPELPPVPEHRPAPEPPPVRERPAAPERPGAPERPPPVSRAARGGAAGPTPPRVAAPRTGPPLNPAEAATPVPSFRATAIAARRRDRRRRALVLGVIAALLLVLAVIALGRTGGGEAVQTPTGGSAAKPAAPSTTSPTPSTQGVPSTTPAPPQVTLDSDAFESGSSALTSAADSQLTAALNLVQTDPARPILVEGYTDSAGDPGENQQLSEARAQSVSQWLTDQGVDTTRISVVGHGADNPVAPNDTPDDMALNRRVVVTLQPAPAQ